MKKTILASILFSLFSVTNFAQGEAALPVLTLQTSLPLLGAGWIGTAKPNNDPIGYYLNPAILGYTSQNNHVSLFFMPTKVNWMPNFNLDLTKNTLGFNLGYNFTELGIPISVGFGYMHDKMDYGTFNRTSSNGPNIIGQFNSYDSYNVYSLGIGIDYFLLFNFGMSIKPFDSNLNSLPTENEIGLGKAEGTAYDYGAMIIAPISKLFFDDIKYKFYETAFIKPKVNFTMGYSVSNIGDEICYIGASQKDPLPRTSRLGYTFDFGFDAQINNTEINLFTYSFTAEVEDLLLDEKVLVTQFGENGWSYYYYTDGYQSPLTDINIWDNLVLLHSNERILLHKGHTLNLLETLTITSGNYSGRSYPYPIGSSGFSLSTEGFSKIIGKSVDNQLLKFLIKYFVLEYNDVFIFKGYYDLGTELEGISLHIKNFEL